MRGGRMKPLMIGAMFALVFATAAQAETLVILAGRVIDPASGESLTNQIILVEDERVAAIGPAETISYPRDARTIDLSNATVLPGLIDTHVHLTSEADVQRAIFERWTIFRSRQDQAQVDRRYDELQEWMQIYNRKVHPEEWEHEFYSQA